MQNLKKICLLPRIKHPGEMNFFLRPIHTRRLILLAYLLTIPTILFWLAVAYSVFAHNHRYVDWLLAPGKVSHVTLVFVLPFISLIIALICRISLKREAIARNLWHVETPELRSNQGLINWNVVLIGVMFISLINN